MLAEQKRKFEEKERIAEQQRKEFEYRRELQKEETAKHAKEKAAQLEQVKI